MFVLRNPVSQGYCMSSGDSIFSHSLPVLAVPDNRKHFLENVV